MFDRLAGPNKDHFPDQISNLATTMFSNQVEKSPLDLVSPEPNIARADDASHHFSFMSHPDCRTVTGKTFG